MKKKVLAYEKIVEEWMESAMGMDIMELVVDNDSKKNKSIPLRYRLIVLGLLKQDTLEDVNDNLLNHGCQPLYARSSHEAVLIYAFAKQLSYKEWKKLDGICKQAKAEWEKEFSKEKHFFGEGGVTFGELEKYVLEYSEITENELITKQITRALNNKILTLGSDFNDFLKFYLSNMEQFLEVREKSRYYFCKYLYYYIMDKLEDYVVRVGNRTPNWEEVFSLRPLMAARKLVGKRAEGVELLELFRSCRISPGELYEELNYYFFGYISSDWVELLLENIKGIEELNEMQIDSIAEYLRANMKKADREKMDIADNVSVVEKHIEKLNDMGQDVGNNRKGEKVMRQYIQGELDIDRTTLICCLLFLGTSVTNRDDIRITQERLNSILDECGYPMLGAKVIGDRKQGNFDRFVINYLKSKDPVSYLMEEMDRYMEREESFLIYEVYNESTSNAKDIRKYMGV